MLLEEIRKKRDFLLSFAANLETAKILQKISNATHSEKDLPEGLRNAVVESLTYAALRHRYFSKTEILRDSLASYLGMHFGLPQLIARRLAERALDSVISLTAESSDILDCSDREFLKYLFVHVACVQSEEDLTQDLGLGTEILARMKKSIDIVAAIQEAEADAPLMFLPDLDAQVCEIMAEMTAETRAKSWALQHQRLMYQLIGVKGPWASLLRENGTNGLFDVLVEIGSRKSTTSKQIIQSLMTKYQGLHTAFNTLEIFENFALAYPDDDPKSDKTKWSLTPFGHHLTQDAFAKSFIERTPNKITTLSNFCPDYQAAVVRYLKDENPQIFVDIALNYRPLSPQALSAAFNRLSNPNFIDKGRKTALQVLREDPSPWLRKAACRSLATTLYSDEVDQVFAEVARSDASVAVRAEAQTALG